MAERSRSWNKWFAKAETLLVLALITETLVNPWLYSQPIPLLAKTLIKMAIVVGCFGPVFNLLSRLLDRSLDATRSMTTSVLSLPKVAAHLAIIVTLFLVFHWTMHRMLPWQGLDWPGTRHQTAQMVK